MLFPLKTCIKAKTAIRTKQINEYYFLKYKIIFICNLTTQINTERTVY